MYKKGINIILLVFLLVTSLSSPLIASQGNNEVLQKIHPNLLKNISSLDDSAFVEVVIRLKPLPDSLKTLVKGDYDLAVATLKSWASYTQEPIVRMISLKGGVVLNRFWLDNVILARVPVSLVKLLATHPDVVKIFENFRVEVIRPVEKGSISDQQLVSSWGIFKIRADEAWSLGYTGEGVRIAVLDTGVDITHPALAGKMLTLDPSSPYYPGGWMEFDASGNPVLSTPHDTDGHGTHTSGTALGGDTSEILIGVAPGATLMHGLVLPGGGGTFAQVLAGMQWTVEPFYLVDGTPVPTGLPAHVVSMSFGANEYYGNDLFPAIENMLLANIIPVAAIGNSGAGTTGNPGNIWGVYGIGATDIDDNVAYFSGGKIVTWPSPPPTWPFFDMYPSTYVKPDFSAPGVSITSAVPGGGYEAWSGTSMATPHVSGLVALVLQAAGWVNFDVEDTPEKVYLILNNTAVDFGDPGLDTRYGWGRVDAYEAVRKAQEYAKKSGVEGFVTDTVSGEPIPWAQVTVLETNQTFKVNSSGYFKIPLDPGNYTLRFEAWGYQSIEVPVTVVLLNGTITGIVFDALTGTPIQGANVTVLELGLSAETDEDGTYQFSVPPGTYTLTAEATGYQPAEATVSVDEAEVVVVNFPLYPLGNGTLYGYVYSAADNTPIQDAVVYTYVGTELVYNVTDSSGYYELSLPSGTYLVRAYKPGFIEANATVSIAPLTSIQQDFYLQPIPPTVVVLGNIYYYNRPHILEIVQGLGLPAVNYTDVTVLLNDWVSGVINPKVVIINYFKPERYTYPSVTDVIGLLLLADAAGTSLIFLGTSYAGYTALDVLQYYNNTIVSNNYPAPYSNLYRYPTYTYVQAHMLNLSHPVFNGVTPDIPPDRFYVCSSGYCDYKVYNFTDPTGRLSILAYVNDTTAGYETYFGVGVAEWLSNTNVPWYYLGSWGESYWVQYIEPGADGVYSENTKKVLENAVLLGWSTLGTGRLEASSLIKALSMFKPTLSSEMIEAGREVGKNLYTRVDVSLERLPHGFVEGWVLGSDETILSNAAIRVIGTPVSARTDENGYFKIWLPEGAYVIEVQAPGYKSEYLEVEVGVNETISLGEIVLRRLPRIGILWDYANAFKNFFEANGWYATTYTSLATLTSDVLAGLIDVVVYSGNYGVPFPSYDEFSAFLNATFEKNVGVIWMDSYGSYGYGIKVLNAYLGDPASVGYGWGSGEVYIRVENAHPLFRGYPVGSMIMINSWTSADYSYFSGFSGFTIGSVYVGGVRRGDGVAFKEFDNGVKWVLLSSFAITSWNTPDTFTDDFWNIVMNSARWLVLRPLEVTIDNPFLHVGDSYTLTITGAEANDTLIIMIDGEIVDYVTSDENGSATYTGVLGLTPGGSHVFEVMNVEETHYGSVEFYVLPKIVVSPTIITVPGRVLAEVTGLTPFQPVYVYLDGNSLSVKLANASGAFTAVLNIPLVDEGLHEVVIADTLGETIVSGEILVVSKLDMILNNTQQSLTILDQLNAEIIGVRDNIVLINTSLGVINVKLDDIVSMLNSLNATIVEVRDGIVLLDSRIGELALNVSMLIQYAEEIAAEIIELRDGVVLINTSLGIINVKLDDIVDMLGALDARISLLNDTMVLVKTKIGDVEVSITQLSSALESVNATLVALIRDESGRIVGVINTTTGDILAELDVIKQLLNDKLPISTGQLNSALSSLQASVNSISQKLDELSSKLEEVGARSEEGVASLSSYALASVALSVIILALLGYVGFVKK